MKFKRILATAFALALTLPLLTISAHPGRTDTNGGHTDSDTGDYHYHHGYPAHEHYDIDNDGQIDCPYDFDDKTGESSGQPSNDSSGSNYSSNNSHNYTVVPHTVLPVATIPDLVLETLPPMPTLHTAATKYEPKQYTTDDYRFGYYICALVIAFLIACPFFLRYDQYKEAKNTRAIIAIKITAAIMVLAISPVLFFLLLFSLPISIPYFSYKAFLYIRKNGRSLHRSGKTSTSPMHSPLTTTSTSASSSMTQSSDILNPAPIATAAVTSTITRDRASQFQTPLPSQTFAKPDPDVDFRPVILPESEVSAHTRCRDTCRYLWYETLMLRSCTKPLISSDATVYIWTALFYTAVKTLRSQSSVDRIYSYFSETTSEFVTEAQYADLVVAKVREVYRELREPLNDSGIDPRTANGRRDLWRFLEGHSEELKFHPDLSCEFLVASQRVWQTIKDVFPQAHPYPKAGDIRYSIDDLPSA